MLARAVTVGVDAGEFSAHQDELGGVIDPDQHHDDRSRGPIGRFEALLADVEADEKFSHLEQRRSQDGAEPDVAPLHRGVGKPFEYHGEKQGDHRERRGEARDLQRRLRQVGCDIFSRGGQRRRQQHRGQEQETECQHPSQGQDVAAHKPPDPRSRRGFHLPHRVQGVLELNHDADGGKDQGANPYCGRDHAFARPVRALEHGFDGLSAGVADEPLQRAENLALHGLGAEDETGNRNRYENQRPEREHGVIGKRRAEPRILVCSDQRLTVSRSGVSHAGIVFQLAPRKLPSSRQ
jgi:hypothetical protein